MNHTPISIVPNCFRDYQQYSEWLGLARAAKQPCTICEDCTSSYKEKMITESRCFEKWYSVQVIMQGKLIAPNPESDRKVTKEFNHEKLYWEFNL